MKDSKFMSEMYQEGDVPPGLGYPTVEEPSRTQVVVLDLDANTVGYCIEEFLRPMFERFFNGDESESDLDSTTVIPIYAINETDSLNHIWEYIKRNAREIQNKEVQLLIVYIGAARQGLNTVLSRVDVPDNVNVATPSYIVNQIMLNFSKTEEELDHINII